MKKVINYCCEICGFAYSSEEDCQCCEASHRKPEKLLLMGYKPVAKAKCPYPEVVVFEMEDGKCISYSYDSEIDPGQLKLPEEPIATSNNGEGQDNEAGISD